MSFETNLRANRIGVITTKNLYEFKLALNEVNNRFEVTGKDGHMWGDGASAKGALISACRCGVRLNKIDTYGVDLNGKTIHEVVCAIKD